MRFFLGTHQVHWLRNLDVPLFISRRRLQRLRTWPRAIGPWAMDSGGFTELATYGEWRMTAAAYSEFVLDVVDRIGYVEWVAPQDWMCEPQIIDRTGLTVDRHQALTVANFLALRDTLGRLVIPVLQGHTLEDYDRCWSRYEASGVDLTMEPLVGLGSVCRRQGTSEIGDIVREVATRGARLHGFGVKVSGLTRYGRLLESADSMAWSYAGRKRGTCPRRCANCLHWALDWRANILTERAHQISMGLG